MKRPVMLRLLRGLGGSMRRHERAHGHYSRACAFLVWLALGAMVVLALLMTPRRPYTDAACRASPDAASAHVQPLDIELARTVAELRRLLAGTLTLTDAGPIEAAVCVAEQVARHRGLLALDDALFIPSYLVLGVAVLGWLLAMSVHTRQADGRWARVRPALPWLLWLSALSAAGVAWLDGVENDAALRVLELSDGLGALAAAGAPDLADAVADAYAAALHKWLAVAAWAASLGAVVWYQRTTLVNTCGSPQRARGRIGRALVGLVLWTSAAAALALAGGVVLGLLSAAAPVDRGPATVRALIGGGFTAFGLSALSLALLDLVRHRVPPTCEGTDEASVPPSRTMAA